MSQAHIDKHFLRLAMAQAHKAEMQDEVPVGAVLVANNNELISSAYNQPIGLHDPTAHAEISCLRRAGKKLKNYRLVNTTLYVTLEPCSMCTGALIHARVKRVVYACRDLRSGACGTALNLAQHECLNHRLQTTLIETPSAIALLQQFFKERRHA